MHQQTLHRIVKLLPLTALLFAVACTGPQYPACETDDDCKEKSEYCVNKQCQQCREDSHCAAGEECLDGRCERQAECSSDADCPSGKICQVDQCVDAECSSDSQCATGQKCDGSRCIEAGCTSDAECAAGETCVDGDCEKRRVSSSCAPNNGQSGAVIRLQTVNFDFNTADLRVDTRDMLDQAAECMREAPEVTIVLEGHCDERGTQEYNLALGEKRANAVRDYLRNLGVDGARIRTISKGRNEPVCYDATESCYSRNRRVEFIQRTTGGY